MVVAAALLLLMGSAGPPTRSFSDVCRELESDDLAGRSVALTPSVQGWRVGYSATEGVLDTPVAAGSTRYDPRTGRLSFEVETWQAVRFRGRIKSHVLSGEITEGGERPTPVKLVEVMRPDAGYPPCR